MLNSGSKLLRWDCKNGENCFNVKKRVKFDIFADCFPGKINFTDVDGLVEINGHFLYMEWKESGGMTTAQDILFKRITADSEKTVALLVIGNAETMEIESVQRYKNGVPGPLEAITTKDFKERLRQWANNAKKKRLHGKEEHNEKTIFSR